MNSPTDPWRAAVAAYATAFEDLAAATTGRTRRGPGGSVLAVSGAPIAALNVIVSPEADPGAEEITALADTENWELPWSIHVRGVPGAEVTEAAARYGLTHRTRQPLMVRGADQGCPEAPAVDGLRVRPVSADDLGVYARTVAAGFGAPPELFEVFTDPAVLQCESITFHLAELDGEPVGTGMTATCGGLNGIYNITTLPEHRRRGYGRAVTLETVRAGFAAGADTAYLYASEMGEPVYRSIGFRTEEYLTVLSAPS